MPSALTTNEVTTLYEDMLFRAPDAGGLAYWVDALDSGQLTLPQVIGAFLGSAEAIGTIEPIVRLYYGLFERAPDAAGMAAWIGYEDAGMSLGAIAQTFVSSTEFYNDYGGNTLANPAAFVETLYEKILGRAADPGGLANWLGVLGAAPTVASEATVVLGFINSTEFADRLGNNVNAWLTESAEGALAADLATTLITGAGGSLVTSAGTWSFSTATAAGSEIVLLNGQPAADGAAMELVIANQDQVYALTTQEHWLEWNGSAWLAASDPTGGASATPPLVTDLTLTVAENGAATAINIPAPSDANYAAADLAVTVVQLPTDGTLLLSNGTTAVTAGESLTVAQLTGLKFLPSADVPYQTSTFTFHVTDPAGLTATGTETLAINATVGVIAPSGAVAAPAIPQPLQSGDIVGLILQNDQSTALTAREIIFGQVFGAGLVPAGSQVEAIIDGVATPVQMDVKTTNADGSAASVVLTMEQPSLAAGSSTDVMLALAPAGTQAGAPIDIANLTDANYQATIALTLHNSDGSSTIYHIDAAQALQQALAAGTQSYWLDGAQATQVRIDVPIAGSLHVTLDITDFAGGATATDVQFNNDYAMTADGGAATYDVTISQNGQVAFQQSNIAQAQYTTWDTTLYSNGAPQVNIQQDIQALENTDAIQAYDLTAGVSAATIAADDASLTNGQFGVLGPGNITQYMGTTGGRDDIGTEPAWFVDWLMTQNQGAAAYALAQTEAAGSIPWHLFDPNTGMYLTVTDYPTLWPDPRAADQGGTISLTQQIPTNTGWSIDIAHEPDTAYVAYLMTGDRYYLDQLNAEASYDVLYNNTSSYLGALFGLGEGIVTPSDTQVRASAWALREVVEAAFINPDGSAEKAYFTQSMNNSFAYLLNEAENSSEGQVSGWIQGVYGSDNGTVAPWEQDYFASTVVLAAEQGSSAAVQLLAWETNFLAGRFLAAAEGFSPYDGAAYNLVLYSGNDQTGAYQSWAQVEAASVAAGDSDNGSWVNMQGDYGALAQESLAGDITVSQSPDAIEAYGWVAYNLSQTQWRIEGYSQFDIIPRLADGNYLTPDNMHLSYDGAGTTNTLQFGDADQMIYAGAGNDTLVGGAGINLLFAGSGADILIGGAGNDYLFGGAGTDTLSGGPGTNFLRAGAGPDTFIFNAGDVANDTVDRFKVGTDHLVIETASGGNLTATGILAGATTDANNDIVLHLGAQHIVTLIGIAPAELTAAMITMA